MLDELLSALDAHQPTYGMTMTEIISLPAPLSSMFRGLVRRRTLSMSEMASALKIAPEEVGPVLERMLAKGMISPAEELEGAEERYRVVLIHTRQRERM